MRKSLYDYCKENRRIDLLEQWDTEKNGAITPHDVGSGSHRKIWWNCGNGHSWQTAVYTRTGGGSGCPYCTGQRVLTGHNDLASQHPELAKQWDPVKNGTLTPDKVLSGSHKRVWWICSRGHEWQAAVKVRVAGCGCPVCSNRRLNPGENDLATLLPDLAAQWHPTKNGTLTPSDVIPGSRQKTIWWQCPRGHEWQARISSRAAGSGCPVCAGKRVVVGENDLASRYPRLAAEWDGEKNGMFLPEQVSVYSNRKVWWKCPLGHSWQTQVKARTSGGSGCPYCAGRKVLTGFNDLSALEPKIAAQWHPALNGTLTPEQVTVGSHKKVWWQCEEGHVWKAVIYSRTGPQKCGCPVCSGRTPQREGIRDGPDRYREAVTALKR